MTPFDGVKQAIATHMPSYDAEVAEVILATVVANKLDGPPVWLMLIAPPSSGKTIALEPLDALPNTKLLSKMTEKTLLSGMPDQNGKPASLLLQLGPTPTLVVKDLGTLLEMNHFSKGDLYAQLREVYDGYISAAYGNGRFVEWPGKGKRGKATLIVGMTPSVDMYHVMESHLGERFLRYQYRSSKSPIELARASIYNTGSEAQLEAELRASYAQCNRMVTMRLARGGPYAGKKTSEICTKLAVLTAAARTSVIRNPYEGHGVSLVPEAEATPRVAKMLWLMAQALCVLRNEDDLSDTDLLTKIAVDNIRNPRRQIYLEMLESEKAGTPMMTLKDFDTAVSPNTLRRQLEDLVLAGVFSIVAVEDCPPHLGPGRPPTYYTFADDTRNLLRETQSL